MATRTPTPTIRTYGELTALIRQHGRRLYVRYSRGPRYDLARGYSLDHATGQAHAGLSAERVLPCWVEAPDAATLEDVAMTITSYRHLLDQGPRGTRAWLYFAESEGTDSDGAPLLLAETAQAVGVLAPALLDALAAIEAERAWRRPERRRYMGITDAEWATRLAAAEAARARLLAAATEE